MSRARTGSYAALAAVAVLLSGLFAAPAVAATTLTFTPSADAQVNSGNVNVNYGSLVTIRTREASGATSDPTYRSFITFDVAGLAGHSVTSVTLRLFTTDASPHGQEVHRVPNAGWSESGITYASPPAFDPVPLATAPVPTQDAYDDLALPASAVGADGRVSFAIRSTGNNSAIFASRESANPPRLVIVVDGTAPTPTPTGTPTATPTATATTTPNPMTLDPIADAQVHSRASTTNYGSVTSFRTREDANPANSTYRSYLLFDVVGLAAPAQSVRLRLFVTDASTSQQHVFAIGNTTWTEGGITYGNAPPIPVGATPLASFTAASTNTYVDIVLPAASIPRAGRYTFALKSAGTNSLIVASREAANRPRLLINGGASGPAVPVGAFAVAPTSGPAPLQVQFTDQSSNGPTAWAWDFDDPSSGSQNTSTQRNPSHTFAGAGSYDVRLTPANGAGTGSPVSHRITVTSGGGSGDAVLVGAGDIADCSRTQDEATATLLDGIAGTVFTAGDNVYENGTASEFANCYGPSWGRHKARTRPVAGNHEYQTSGASGYYGYFGSAAGAPSKGYYSFDIGAWHAVVLNSNCSQVGGCGATSSQASWLRSDLAANPASCTIAIWHHPRFSSSQASPDGLTAPLWQILYDAGADLILVGHRHNYERFAPQTPAGAADPSFGIREFVVGTGGVALVGFSGTMANSQVRNSSTYGVLKLTLRASSYDFSFVHIAGQSFTDSGSASCHAAPSAAARTTAAAATDRQLRRWATDISDRARRRGLPSTVLPTDLHDALIGTVGTRD